MRCGCDLKSVIQELAMTTKVIVQTIGAYDSYGRWEDQPQKISYLKLVVQPAKPKDLRELPEGRRTEGAIIIHSLEKLNGLSVNKQTQPTKIEWHGDVYEIHSTEDWTVYGGFFKYVATKVGQ